MPTGGIQLDDERKWVDEYFAGKRGIFLDIGAYDGVTDSITRGLAEAGWYGVMVEADAESFCKLRSLYHNDPRISLVHCGLIPDGPSGLRRFWEAENTPNAC